MSVRFDAISAALIHAIDAFTQWTGKLLAWSCLAMVLVMGAVVCIRYFFAQSSIAAQELVTYFHAFVFMLGAAFTLKANEHVRVDIFFQKQSAKKQAWINAFGTVVFLVPVCVFIFYMSWDYVAMSWRVSESSREAGGLSGVYLLKTLLLVMPSTLILQGLAEFLRNLRVILGIDVVDADHGSHVHA